LRADHFFSIGLRDVEALVAQAAVTLSR